MKLRQTYYCLEIHYTTTFCFIIIAAVLAASELMKLHIVHRSILDHIQRNAANISSKFWHCHHTHVALYLPGL